MRVVSEIAETIRDIAARAHESMQAFVAEAVRAAERVSFGGALIQGLLLPFQGLGKKTEDSCGVREVMD